MNASDMSSMPEGGLLRSYDRETVISIATVVTFVICCKMYNHFFALPTETYSDADITKMALIGILATFASRAAITALFERPIDVGSALGARATTEPSAPEAPRVPQMTRLVRN
tara:strand:+ start:663 stop:1001 length:339 start_codon:yes stop_codon:yes gene_type:complete